MNLYNYLYMLKCKFIVEYHEVRIYNQIFNSTIERGIWLYRYKVYNNLTTSLSKVENCNNKNIVGYVKKSYSNFIKRIIDFIGDGKFFNYFEVYGKNHIDHRVI